MDRAHKIRNPAGRRVVRGDDFRVSLKNDPRLTTSSFIMMWREEERNRVRNMSTRTYRRTRAWTFPLVVVALAGLSFFDIWVVSMSDVSNGLRLINTAILFAICLILLWRRRAPVAVLCAVMVMVGVQAMFFSPSVPNPGEQPTLESFLALLLGFYSVAAYAEMRRAILGAAIVGAAILAIDIPRLIAGTNPGDIIPAWLFYTTVWFIGRTIRRGRLQAARLQDLAAQLELEREEKARTAVLEERSRISRELHDIIAHSVSVMVVQAQAAERLLEGEQRESRKALGSIETTGRQALAEMRRLLGTLRRTDAELALAPQPSLKHLDALVEQAREAGLPVELRVEGDAGSLPPGVDLTAYRIVQEALTNVRKHAGGAHASVVVRRRDDGIELEITDDGPGSDKNDGTGQGLIGMRERVALYGGVFESGKREDGGYLVRARLPLDSDRP
jgi:signal transduction histidine kinase